MTILGMSEAGQRAGMTREGIRRALLNADVPLIRINPRVFAVEEADLEAFVARRGVSPGRGRPRKTAMTVTE